MLLWLRTPLHIWTLGFLKRASPTARHVLSCLVSATVSHANLERTSSSTDINPNTMPKPSMRCPLPYRFLDSSAATSRSEISAPSVLESSHRTYNSYVSRFTFQPPKRTIYLVVPVLLLQPAPTKRPFPSFVPKHVLREGIPCHSPGDRIHPI